MAIDGNSGDKFDQTEMTEGQLTRKVWHRPGLRKLPIAATSGTQKAIVKGNDGQGQGKGDVSVLNS